MTLANNVSTRRSSTYAAGADFCRTFAKDMNSLYLLAFLMTADGKKAEECFASALEDSTKSNRIFKDWAPSWARRMVIQNAIRIDKPAPDQRRDCASLRPIGARLETKAENTTSLGAVVSLASFERWTEAELHNDTDALDKLMADTIVITQPDGSIQTKADTIAYVRDKSNHWDIVVSENMKVHVYGDTVVVTGTYHEKGASAGKRFDNHGFFTDTWMHINGKWRCIAGHDSYAVKE